MSKLVFRARPTRARPSTLREAFIRLRAVGLTQAADCPLPVTQMDLADALGLSNVHVNRILQELRGAGLIRLRVGLPSGYQDRPASGSSIFQWFNAVRRPSIPAGHEPIALELQLDRPDPGHPRLCVTVAFGPVKDYPPKDRTAWRERCQKLYTMFRQYLGA